MVGIGNSVVKVAQAEVIIGKIAQNIEGKQRIVDVPTFNGSMTTQMIFYSERVIMQLEVRLTKEISRVFTRVTVAQRFTLLDRRTQLHDRFLIVLLSQMDLSP